MFKIILISLLALNLQAGMITKSIKKAVISKTKDVIIDKSKEKAKDKAKTTFKEKVMNNPKAKKQIDTQVAKLEDEINKRIKKPNYKVDLKKAINGK